MYDLPHLRGAHGRFWAAVAQDLPGAPAELDQKADLWKTWQSPDLFLSQTCGLPFRAKLHNQVQLVTTPDYGLAGAAPGYYYSVIVARQRGTFLDLKNGTLAYNEALSQSGWAAIHAHGIGSGPRLQTGAHALSAKAVSDGRADLAALDAVTWRLIRANFPDLYVIDRTAPTPALPLITRAGDPVLLRAALRQGLNTLSISDRTALGITGFVDIPAQTYLALPLPPIP